LNTNWFWTIFAFLLFLPLPEEAAVNGSPLEEADA
jgi:hypothetical protein